MALEVKDLSKKYTDFTLDNVSFTLPAGCIMGFIGENGAGKSTTIRLMLGLAHADGGSVSVLGEADPSRSPRIKEHLGVVIDDCGFPENLTVSEIVNIMKYCFKTWSASAFSGYIKRFDLPTNKPVKELSRGMRMKLSIAVALSHDSRLLLLDEATSGLDPIVRDEILDILLDFIQDEEHSVFISSHIISDLEKICDYITFIHKGKIIFSESKDELLVHYAVVKCAPDDYDAVPRESVVGMRRNKFGIEALVDRGHIPANTVSDPASIEDIMLYFVREGKK